MCDKWLGPVPWLSTDAPQVWAWETVGTRKSGLSNRPWLTGALGVSYLKTKHAPMNRRQFEHIQSNNLTALRISFHTGATKRIIKLWEQMNGSQRLLNSVILNVCLLGASYFHLDNTAVLQKRMLTFDPATWEHFRTRNGKVANSHLDSTNCSMNHWDEWQIHWTEQNIS